MKCPYCKFETVSIARKGSDHYNAFCVQCHRNGQVAITREGAYYNFTDKPTTMQPPMYDWVKSRPDIFGYEVRCFGRV